MSSTAPNAFCEKLDLIERLARGSKLVRLLHNPLRYISAIGYWRLIYPLTKRGKFVRCRTFFGAEMQLTLPAATEIFLFGAKTHDSEIRLTRFLKKNLQPDDVFCDVGAHFGYYSLLAARLVGEGGRVFSIEASQSTFAVLEKNIADQNNIIALHRAASDAENTLVFNEFPILFSEYNSLVLPEKEQAKWLRDNRPQTIEVYGIRLDDFFAKQKLTPSLIKIDAEGAEPQVLRGLEKLLKRNSPTLVVEYSPGELHRKAAGFLQNLGYQSFLIEKNGELTQCDRLDEEMTKRGWTSENLVFKK